MRVLPGVARRFATLHVEQPRANSFDTFRVTQAFFAHLRKKTTSGFDRRIGASYRCGLNHEFFKSHYAN